MWRCFSDHNCFNFFLLNTLCSENRNWSFGKREINVLKFDGSILKLLLHSSFETNQENFQGRLHFRTYVRKIHELFFSLFFYSSLTRIKKLLIKSCTSDRIEKIVTFKPFSSKNCVSQSCMKCFVCFFLKGRWQLQKN